MAWPDFLPPDDRDVYDELVRELQGARGFNQQARQDTLDTVRRAYIGSGGKIGRETIRRYMIVLRGLKGDDN